MADEEMSDNSLKFQDGLDSPDGEAAPEIEAMSRQQIAEMVRRLRLRCDELESQNEQLRLNEAQLRHSEEVFRTLAEHSPDIIVRFDTELRHIYANPAIETVTGVKPEAFIGKTAEQMGISKETADELEATVSKVFETAKAADMEFDFDGPQGRRSYTLRAAPEFGADRSVVSVLCFAHDITDEKAYEHELDESRQRLELAIESGQTGTWDWDIRNGRITCNRRLYEILGMPTHADDVPADTFFECVVREDITAVKRLIIDVLKSGEDFKSVFRVVGADEQMHWLSATGRLIRDDEGKAVRMIGVTYDITQRKQIEDALQLERERLQSILNAIPDPIYIVNAERDIEYVNPAMEQQMGRWEGRKCYEYLHSDRQVCSACNYESVFEGRTIRGEWTNARDGHTYDCIETPLINADGSVSKLEIMRDITEAKQTEERLTADLEAMMLLHKVARYTVTSGSTGETLQMILDATVEIAGADSGNLHRLDPQTGKLTAEARQDYKCPFLDMFNDDSKDVGCTCTEALENGERVIVEDISQCGLFAGTGQIEILTEAGVGAAQATPLLSRDGELLGVLSTHWRQPHIPDEHALRFIDMLARQAADFIERTRYLEEVQNTARFPEENPFPVLRIADDGQLIYHNPSSISLLDIWRCKVGEKVPANWAGVVSKALSSGQQQMLEMVVDDHTLQFAFAPVVGGGYVNVYGADVTEQKRAEDKLRKAHDELEEIVRQRTQTLAETVKFLETEVEQRTRAERMLQERSRVLNAFFWHSITPLVILDRDLNFVRVNKAYADACQRDVSEFPGHNHFEFYPHEENEQIFRRVVETKSLHQAVAKPFSFPDHPEWGVTYWDWTLVPILDEDGQVESLVFALQDVTARKESEMAMIESEARYRSLVELSPDAIVVIVDNQFVFVNQAAVKLGGASSPEELIGLKVIDFVHEDCRQQATEWLRQVLEENTAVGPNELTAIRLDGEPVEVEISQSPIIYRGQRAVQAVLRDVTERKRQRDKLLLSEQRLEMAQRIAHLGNWDWDIVDNTLWWSDEVFRIFGLEPQQFGATYEHFLSYVHPDDKNLVQAAVNDSVDGRQPYSLDHRVVRPDGVMRIVHEQGEVFYDEQGEPARMIGTVQDITELRSKEQELLESEKRFRIFGQAIDDVLWMCTPGIGEILYVSPSYEKVWCNSRESLYEQPTSFMDRVHPQDRPRLVAGLQGHALGVWHHEYRIVRPDGSIRWIYDRGYPMRDENGEVYLMCRVASDITARKRAEERILEHQQALQSLTSQLQLAEEAEKRRLAADLHDSIGQILAFSRRELISLESDADGRVAEGIREVSEQIDLAVKQVRTLSFELSPSTLYDLGLDAAIEDLVDQYSEKEALDLKFESDGDCQDLPDAMKILLYRSVRELLINIIKHARAKSATISMTTLGSEVEIVVVDDGVGFDPSTLKSRSDRHAGYGLFSIYERLGHIGGDCRIESKPGKGARVTLTAPFMKTLDDD